MRLVLRGKQLIDGTGLRPLEDGIVVMEGGSITAVGPYGRAMLGNGGRVVELPEHTLAPGLIDSHSHASHQTVGPEAPEVTGRSEGEVALWAVHWLGRDVRSGVTTMRSLGTRGFMDSAFKRAQEAGRLAIPRLVSAQHAILSSLGRVNGGEYVDGPDAVRRCLREAVRGGAEWVKFHATPNSRAADPTLPLFSIQEVDAIFDEARRLGRPVAVHCHGGPAADWCIERGVDSLEHGLYLEESQFNAMAKKGVILVATTGVVLLQPEQDASARLMETKRRARSFLREARRQNVKCLPGSDGVHGNLASELLAMIDAGWSPMETIQSATQEAAALLRLTGSTGTLEAGKWADVVAFRGDPLKDPEALKMVDLVVQGGRIVHSDPMITGWGQLRPADHARA